MTEKRDSPYVWVTWLAKQMAGEVDCRWQLWFKANHKYNKIPPSIDLAAWAADHDKLRDREQEQLLAAGWDVKKESQNQFNIAGQSCTLGGKPDLVAVNDEEVLITECKTGQHRNSDVIQTLVYMWALPIVFNYCRGRLLRGRVVYKDGDVVDIPASRVDETFETNLKETMSLTASDPPPAKSPSPKECRFCDIPKEDCPDRIEAATQTGKTNVF